jgi:hypothetical protein
MKCTDICVIKRTAAMIMWGGTIAAKKQFTRITVM